MPMTLGIAIGQLPYYPAGGGARLARPFGPAYRVVDGHGPATPSGRSRDRLGDATLCRHCRRGHGGAVRSVAVGRDTPALPTMCGLHRRQGVQRPGTTTRAEALPSAVEPPRSPLLAGQWCRLGRGGHDARGLPAHPTTTKGLFPRLIALASLRWGRVSDRPATPGRPRPPARPGPGATRCTPRTP